MERIAVISRALKAVGYDPTTLTLEVEYLPNSDGVAAVWHYKPVAQAVFDAMFAPQASVGSILASIKRDPEVYAYRADTVSA
jgi:hypothetical protein